MVFWKTYPIINWINSFFTNRCFESHIFTKKCLYLSPLDFSYRILNNNIVSLYELEEIHLFLKKYFGNPPSTPTLNIPIECLLEEDDIIIIVKNLEAELIGCIRYHFIGKFITGHFKDIYYVDCFCIHPSYRKKGIGDFLLSTLHNYANKNNISYALFLKEGRSLNIFNRPLYSGRYVYKEITKFKTENIHSYLFSKSISKENAFSIMGSFMKFNKYIIIRNWKGQNQHWKIYKNGLHMILACFQDTYQEMQTDNGKSRKIAWCTAWFETPTFPENLRNEAIDSLIYLLHPTFEYVWLNSKWIGDNNDKTWKNDGPFHWYSYQWTTCIKPNKFYCLTI